jgi:chromosome segregation ATPase
VTLLATLISVTVSVAVIFIVRQLDKDNNSLDKVKRYADKRQADFDVYFKEQVQKLSGLSADLDTHQTAAGAAVKRLEKQTDEFRSMSSGFEKNFDSIETINNRIASYDKSLGELVAMTGKVEENLQKVRAESVIVDKLTAKIDDQQKAVAALQKTIPQIEADFERKNGDQLKSIGTNLLEEYKQLVQQLDASARKAEQQSHEVLESISKSIRSAYDEAARKAASLEDTALRNVNEQSEKRYESYLNAVKSQTQELARMLESEVSDLKQKFTGELTVAKRTAEELAADVAGNGKTLETLRTSVSQQTAEIQARYTDLCQKAIVEADSRESAAYTKFLEVSNGHLESYKASVEDKINTLHTDISGKLNDVQGSADQQINQLKQLEESASAALRAHFEEISGELQQQSSDARKETADTLERLHQDCAEAENKAVAIESAVTEKTENAAARLADFQQDTETKFASLQTLVTDTMKKMTASYDVRQTELLGEIDHQLDEYRKAMDYRFSKLEMTGNDVDQLEKNLRTALEQAQKQVLDDFSRFAGEQQTRQSDFETTVRNDSTAIAGQITALEKNLEEIKATATDNVSAVLKDFEDSVSGDLKKRGDAVDAELDSWKQGFDTRLTVIGSDYEGARRELETKYSEELKAQLAAIQDKNRDQTARIEESIKKSQSDVLQQITDVQQSLRSFTEKCRGELQSATEGSEALVKSSLDGYNGRINGLLEKTEKDIGVRLDNLDQTVKNRQETNTASIDAMVGDFNAWRTQLKQQFEETRSLFSGQLGGLKQSADQKIDELKATFDASMGEYTEKTKEQQLAVSAEIQQLCVQVEQSVAGYKERSEKILAEQQKMYEEMLQETQKRVREQNADADKALRELRVQIQTVTDDNEAREAKMVMKMQNDATDLQTRMSEIDKQVKAFAAQMQVYEKADQLKAQLESQLADLKSDLTRVDSYQVVIADLENHFKSIQKLNTDVEQKLSKFSMEKGHIDSLEHNFDHLLQMSSSMDQKINELQTTSDDLQSMQLTVRKFQETLTDISGRYDRLEKKQDIIEQVSGNVDKTFEDLKALEQRLNDASRQVVNFPDTLGVIQKNVESILSNSGRINDAMDKIVSLQSMIDETGKRIDQIQTAREGIARSETRLQNLSKEIDDKFQLLGKITAADIEKNPGQKNDRITPQDKEAIIRLKRQGWDVSQIARSMKRSEGEIELVLEMGTDR